MKLVLAAFSRVDTPEEQRKDFAIIADEMQTICSPGIAFCAASTRMASAWRGPMRVSALSQLATTAATSAQKPANMGERPSTRK